MILSRIAFNPLHRDVYRLVSDPYGLHQRLCRCVDASRSEASLLFRWDDGPTLLVQSSIQPDWSKLGVPKEAFKKPPESKDFNPAMSVGQRLAFRLLCRPCKKQAVPGSRNSRLRYLRSDEERLEWLKRQGKRWGFAVESVIVSQERWRETKKNAPESCPGRQTELNLPATRFDGVLVVTEPDKLAEAVRKGIGPQKAFGFGLLSLARLDF